MSFRVKLVPGDGLKTADGNEVLYVAKNKFGHAFALSTCNIPNQPYRVEDYQPSTGMTVNLKTYSSEQSAKNALRYRARQGNNIEDRYIPVVSNEDQA